MRIFDGRIDTRVGSENKHIYLYVLQGVYTVRHTFITKTTPPGHLPQFPGTHFLVPQPILYLLCIQYILYVPRPDFDEKGKYKISRFLIPSPSSLLELRRSSVVTNASTGSHISRRLSPPIHHHDEANLCPPCPLCNGLGLCSPGRYVVCS
jgi:hypothetical protein